MKAGRIVILEIGLLSSILLAPIFFGCVYPWASLSLVAVLFFLLFLYPETLFAFFTLPRLFRWGMVTVFGAVFFQWCIFSLNRYETGCELLKWLAFAAGFFLVRQLPPSSILRLLAAYVALGVLETAYGLFQLGSGKEMVLWQNKEAYLGFATGTYLNRNHLAGALELSLGVHLGLLLFVLQRGNIRVAALLGLLFLVSLIGFLKTGSRMAVISFAGSSLFFAMILLGTGRKISRSLFFLLFLTVGAAFLHAGEALLLRFRDFLANGASWEGRLLVWRDAIRMLKDYPWMGVGLGNFKWLFPTYQSSESFLGWSHAHNDYLELACELGIPFFAILALSFLGIWLTCVKKLFSVDDVQGFAPMWGILIAVTSLGVHGFADFNLAIPANAWLVILLLGMAGRLPGPSEMSGKSYG